MDKLLHLHARKVDLIGDYINDLMKTTEIIFANILFAWQKFYIIWHGKRKITQKGHTKSVVQNMLSGKGWVSFFKNPECKEA